LGVVLSDILTGTRRERMAASSGGEGRRLPSSLAGIIARATQTDPSQRYASAEEMSAAIDQALAPVRLLPAVAVAAAVMLILVFAMFIWHERRRARDYRSVAVVEIENLSQDPSLDWMERGISELLTIGLMQSETLSVISAERIHSLIGRRVKGDTKLPPGQIRDVAADARADVFISGVLLRLGPRLRLDVNAQDTTSGRVLFAHRAEGDDPQAMFRMADDTADLLAGQLSGSTSRKAAAQEALTANVEALKAYTEGLRFGRRWLPGEAIASMQKAVKLDPSLAMAHYWIAQWGGLWDPRLCRDEVQQAMVLAEGLALPRSQKLRIRMGQTAPDSSLCFVVARTGRSRARFPEA
jgi:TolB-like protein